MRRNQQKRLRKNTRMMGEQRENKVLKTKWKNLSWRRALSTMPKLLTVKWDKNQELTTGFRGVAVIHRPPNSFLCSSLTFACAMSSARQCFTQIWLWKKKWYEDRRTKDWLEWVQKTMVGKELKWAGGASNSFEEVSCSGKWGRRGLFSKCEK